MKLLIEWGMYGCESGCDGHTLSLFDDDGGKINEEWVFSHIDTNDDAADVTPEMAIKWAVDEWLGLANAGVSLDPESTLMDYYSIIHKFDTSKEE